MNNRRLTLLALMICVCLSAVTRGEWPLADVLAEGGPDDAYWVCIVREDDKAKAGEKPVTSSLRQRVDPVTGRWIEVAGLQARVVDIAAAGSDLAVLTSGGDWKLIHGGQGVVEGAALPSPYRPISFGSDGNTLYAIAAPAQSPATTGSSTQPDAKAAAFRWTGNGWALLANLPSNADASRVAIAGGRDSIYLASESGDSIVIDRLDGDKWKRFTDAPRAGVADFKLLHSASQLRLARQDAQGAWTITSIGDDATTGPKPLSAELPSDVAMVGSTLRLVFEDDEKKIAQLSIDQYGTGQTFGPDVVAQIVQQPQSANAWSIVAMLAMLVVTMLVTLRQRPGLPGEIANATTLRLAPLGRRMAAGVLDMLPLIATLIYTLRVVQQNPNQTHEMTQWHMLLSYLALLVYVVHTTIGEAMSGRSFGKWLFGLRVVGYDGAPVSVGRIILRNMLRTLDVMLLFLPLLLPMFTPLRQRVGDLAARTVVIAEDVPDAEDTTPSAE